MWIRDLISRNISSNIFSYFIYILVYTILQVIYTHIIKEWTYNLSSSKLFPKFLLEKLSLLSVSSNVRMLQ